MNIMYIHTTHVNYMYDELAFNFSGYAIQFMLRPHIIVNVLILAYDYELITRLLHSIKNISKEAFSILVDDRKFASHDNDGWVGKVFGADRNYITAHRTRGIDVGY